MDEARAIIEAQKVADAEGITMAVYFDPYAEYETDHWGWMPKQALRIFQYHESRHTITPGGN